MKNFKGTESRHIITREYCKKFIPQGSTVLDLGYENKMTLFLDNNYSVRNTEWDLNVEPKRINKYDYDYLTAFEIFEHLLNTYSVLENVRPGTGLLCSVPLRVWYAKPYWLEDDRLQHYHEFLPREFFKLLNKTGFEIKFSKKHCIVKGFGIRQLITGLFRVKRYLFVYAVKKGAKR